MPQVSILMSVYNGMPYLPAAVDSILYQTFQDFTLLIINDGSTDGSAAYLNHLTDPRVEVVHRPHRGLGAALNVGLAMCETEFLARMDADDVALPDRIATQLNFLSQHPEVGTVGSQIAYLGPSGRAGFSPRLPYDHETIYADLLHVRHALCHATIACRTALLKQIGGYRISGCGEDWDMMLRIGEISRLANVDRVLYLYRLHPNSANATKFAEIQVGCAFASHNAKCRAKNCPETTLADFVAARPPQSFWRHMADWLDRYAFTQYRRALLEVLSARELRGYVRLGWAALCSPPRTWQRICRLAPRIHKRGTPRASVPA
jgi:glycosyltransferase involved in cell wall biosynthesis